MQVTAPGGGDGDGTPSQNPGQGLGAALGGSTAAPRAGEGARLLAVPPRNGRPQPQSRVSTLPSRSPRAGSWCDWILPPPAVTAPISAQVGGGPGLFLHLGGLGRAGDGGLQCVPPPGWMLQELPPRA